MSLQFIAQQGFTAKCVSQFGSSQAQNFPKEDHKSLICEPCVTPEKTVCRCCCNCFSVYFSGVTGTNDYCQLYSVARTPQDFLLDVNQFLISGTRACQPFTIQTTSCSWGVDLYASYGTSSEFIGRVTLQFGIANQDGQPPNCHDFTWGEGFLIFRFECENQQGVGIQGIYLIDKVSCTKPMTAVFSYSTYVPFTSESPPGISWPTNLTIYPAACAIPPIPTCTGNCTYVAGNPTEYRTVLSGPNTAGVYQPIQKGKLSVHAWAPGGGGGGSDSGAVPGGDGGGSGGAFQTIGISALSTQNYSWSIGHFGVKGVANTVEESGGDGGNTSVSDGGAAINATAYGGKGGLGVNTSKTSGSAGGTATGLAATLYTGGDGTIHNGTQGGNGGSAPNLAGAAITGGTGGTGGSVGTDGQVGTYPGAGGGGAGRHNSGGDGANGRIEFNLIVYDWIYSNDDCLQGCSTCKTVDNNFYTMYGRPSSSSDTLTVPCS